MVDRLAVGVSKSVSVNTPLFLNSKSFVQSFNEESRKKEKIFKMPGVNKN